MPHRYGNFACKINPQGQNVRGKLTAKFERCIADSGGVECIACVKFRYVVFSPNRASLSAPVDVELRVTDSQRKLGAIARLGVNIEQLSAW